MHADHLTNRRIKHERLTSSRPAKYVLLFGVSAGRRADIGRVASGWLGPSSTKFIRIHHHHRTSGSVFDFQGPDAPECVYNISVQS